MSDTTVAATPGKTLGFLTKRFLGLPIGVWILLVGAVAWFVYRRYGGSLTGGKATASSGGTDLGDTSAVPDESTNTDGTAAGGASGGVAAGGMGSGVMSTTNSYATNSEWESAVETGLLANGMSASDVNNALAVYMGGGELTPAQVQIIDTAIGQYGEPPSGALPINEVTPAANSSTPTATGSTQQSGSTSGAANTGSSATSPAKTTPAKSTPAKSTAKAPAKKAAPARTTYSTYTIRHGDTYDAIARKYYGSASSEDVSALEKANPGEPARDLRVGSKIKVPHKSGAMGHYTV